MENRKIAEEIVRSRQESLDVARKELQERMHTLQDYVGLAQHLAEPSGKYTGDISGFDQNIEGVSGQVRALPFVYGGPIELEVYRHVTESKARTDNRIVVAHPSGNRIYSIRMGDENKPSALYTMRSGQDILTLQTLRGFGGYDVCGNDPLPGALEAISPNSKELMEALKKANTLQNNSAEQNTIVENILASCNSGSARLKKALESTLILPENAIIQPYVHVMRYPLGISPPIVGLSGGIEVGQTHYDKNLQLALCRLEESKRALDRTSLTEVGYNQRLQLLIENLSAQRGLSQTLDSLIENGTFDIELK
ncbi:hypothetical protein FJZ21_03970 [Candidatus Pacearchaeota archaeon]|nr:hypothetical protein [Candidatus Pacearchaeota archaeon]